MTKADSGKEIIRRIEELAAFFHRRGLQEEAERMERILFFAHFEVIGNRDAISYIESLMPSNIQILIARDRNENIIKGYFSTEDRLKSGKHCDDIHGERHLP
ncbi:MAG: hypothetical protein CML67_06205 [Rhodobacteraceae bacterium]|nr:hypothetical protein [Paracoccaceae bacterium]|tara:strand:- start:139 stop:444 length:306 start_codon:yes stop_codon:yes gene_type:complete